MQSAVPTAFAPTVTADGTSRSLRLIPRVQPIRRIGNSTVLQSASEQHIESMAGDSNGAFEAAAGVELHSSTPLKRSREKSEAPLAEDALPKAAVAEDAAKAAVVEDAVPKAAVVEAVTVGVNVPDVPPSSPPVVEASMGANESNTEEPLTGKALKKQQQGKTKKKKGPCPVWDAVIRAVKAKDAAAAWHEYQSNKVDYDFQVFQLQALATLFLGTC